MQNGKDLKILVPGSNRPSYRPCIALTPAISDLVSNLKRKGVSQDLIEEALAETMHR